MVVFFAASYAITWSLWFASRSTRAEAPRELLFLLGTFTPLG
jgi:hypothetical protein